MKAFAFLIKGEGITGAVFLHQGKGPLEIMCSPLIQSTMLKGYDHVVITWQLLFNFIGGVEEQDKGSKIPRESFWADNPIGT